MNIEYYHASKFGNGIQVAEEFKRLMSAKGVTVNVHHVNEAKTGVLPPADLYVFSSPSRLGKPIKSVRRFLSNVQLAPGTRYAILTTQLVLKPNKKTGKMPTEEEAYQRIIPIMNDLLQAKGLQKVVEERIHVIAIKGPLEEGWQKKVEAFVGSIQIDGK